ncbi:hypothetical protein VNO80_03543 [Phaseolus coccineus]|uniref:Uncharacterized protein n=1 Tax=Phaseolus coccineus TaxID=3886 RepID=A0AAN9RNP3_PHACN
MTNLPTPKTTATATTTTTTDALRCGAIPRHVSKSATPKASAASAAFSATVASAHLIPREVTEPAEKETPTTTSAAGIAAPVAVLGEVIEIATLVARGTASARAIPPGAEAVARASIASGGTEMEWSAFDIGVRRCRRW